MASLQYYTLKNRLQTLYRSKLIKKKEMLGPGRKVDAVTTALWVVDGHYSSVAVA